VNRPRIKSVFLIQMLLLTSIATGVVADDTDPNTFVSPKLFEALKYRLVGPFRGGRSTAVTGVPGDIFTYYMGTTGGGVWKTTDAGETWKNVTDGFINVGSIGAVAVADSDPNVVYVGTGSACPRGNVSIGDGVYKSTDGGKTWKHIGLKKAGLISRIRIHPQNSDLAYAAVLGNIFGPNPERGVYRTRDGGKTWEKVLFIDEKTGACDLIMDSTNPRILYAGMWQVERKPWTLIDGGPKGGVYKTVDGGANWEKLEKGLPDGELGRIGVAVSPANPNRVWVILAAGDDSKSGLYRSEDGGKSFKLISDRHDLFTRAWYYNHIFADPQDENTVYNLNAAFHESVDGGKSWERIRVPHGDNHDLWINPNDNKIWINANDGGANVSFNGGKTWSTQFNQPTAEFYRVSLDNQFPYRLYGSQQDNSTISVPSASLGGSSPKEQWQIVGGGESGHVAVDPRNPDIIYSGNYIGQITRLDRAKGHARNITAYPEMHDGMAGREIRYRFQWNAPIRISPHNPQILYHTSQYVHRSLDGGQTWETISPDLTTNNDIYQDIPGGPIQHDHTGVELYTTIFAFEESPHKAGELWTGSDDGLVYISRDNGKNWSNITPAEMPPGGTVNMIDLSAHAPGRALIAVYKYRENDFRPYVFRTNDYGENWELLTDGKNGIPEDHFVRVVREDPDRKGLLYAGTEFGMYISFDDGRHWQPFQLNLPKTPITDLAVYRQDLVVATQGRSYWILDDITPLHQVRKETAESDAYLFQPRTAIRTQLQGYRSDRAPESPPNGALIFFYFKDKPESAVRLEILSDKSEVIRTFSTEEKDADKKLEVEEGMNRFIWDLRYPKPFVIKGSVMSLSRISGTPAPPGSYRVRLSTGEWSRTRDFAVSSDPRWTASRDDLLAQFELGQAVGEKLTETHRAIQKIRDIREQITQISKRALDAGYGKEIQDAKDSLDKQLTAIEEELIQTKNEAGQDPINYPPKLDNQYAYLHGVVNRQDARPTAGCYERFEDLNRQLTVQLEKLDALISKELRAFSEMLDKKGVGRIILGNEKKSE